MIRKFHNSKDFKSIQKNQELNQSLCLDQERYEVKNCHKF